MSAPLNIDEFIEDIINELIAQGRKLPLHIPAMGECGGVGCYILSVNRNKKEVEILYLAPNHTSFLVSQKEYEIVATYFNSLKGRSNKREDPLEYTVSMYNQSNGVTWKGPFDFHNDPLLPSIFKELGY